MTRHADEFRLLSDNAAEVGLPFTSPHVRRVDVALPDGRTLSALRWGDGAAALVLLHGGAQNAHTWDTVALALGVPLLAVDLPGHGHSDWRDDGYSPATHAEDVALAVRELAPDAAAVVGMSLGGLTTIVLAARHSELVRRAVIVDVTPGVDRAKGAAIAAFVDGPEHFADFEEILARTVAHNPSRPEASLRRGVLHNAVELPDGRWTWRYDRRRWGGDEAATVDFTPLWDDVAAIRCPTLLLRGSLSPVVGDEDLAEWRRRRPDDPVVVVHGAGHSIQGDRPLELAGLVRDFALT